MARRVFRPYDPEARLPLPADLRQWLPTDHTVYLLSDILDELDLTAITGSYDQGDGGGNPPYHPVLLTKLLLYAYGEGVVSSRRIAAKTYTDVAFRVLTCDQHPDFRTISDFRERHLAALTDLFQQVVRLAMRLGLAPLQHVAQDGSKILANASKHRAMSYGRMQQAEARLGQEIAALLDAARTADAAEDTQHGAARSGDELPAELAGEIVRRERRLATIRAAKTALEEEAQGRAAAIRAADAAERERRSAAAEPKKPGRPPNPSGTPAEDAQRNFTDPDSRIMKNGDHAYVQAYNGQAAVDAGGHQMIVGCDLTNQAADAPHLPSMVAQVHETTGQTPAQWSADAGYFSTSNVTTLQQAGSEAFVPPDAQHHTRQPLPTATATVLAAAGLALPAAPSTVEADVVATVLAAAMRATLRSDVGRAAYGQRKKTVEPVFGQLKERRGLRRFLLRGLAKVRGEWTLWCLTHNLGKVVRALRTIPELRPRLACTLA